MDERTDDGLALAIIDASALALGEDTLVIVSGDVVASDGASVDSAGAASGALAIGGTLAIVEIVGLAEADSGDGAATGVEAATSSTAIGDASLAAGAIQVYAMSTDSAEVAFGTAHAAASGDTYQTADALLILYGEDATNSGLRSVETASPLGSTVDMAGILISMEDVDLDYDSKRSVELDIQVVVASDVAVDGNTTTLILDAEAVGGSTLVEVGTAVLTADELSSVALSIVAVAG